MARPNKAELQRQQKDAKQKKVLFVLVPVFLALVVWQGPKMFKALSGSEPEAAPPPVATTAPADPATTAPADPATASPPTGTTEATPAAGLADTDVPPAPGTDRLVSFSRFESRDPFGEPGGTAAGTQTDTGSTTTAPGDDATTLVATLEVNGSSEEVSAGGDFPAGDPTFRLVSLTAGTALIGLVSGSFEGGEDAVELAVGDEVELVADPDGTRYVVTLVSIG